jgi:hypothetical protein
MYELELYLRALDVDYADLGENGEGGRDYAISRGGDNFLIRAGSDKTYRCAMSSGDHISHAEHLHQAAPSTLDEIKAAIGHFLHGSRK